MTRVMDPVCATSSTFSILPMCIPERSNTALNLGTGHGTTVKELLETVQHGIPPPSTAFQHRFISQSLMRLLVL